MADVIHTHDTHDVNPEGSNLAAILAVVLIVLLLLVGAWWLFFSGSSPFTSETNIFAPDTDVQTTPQNQAVPAVPNQDSDTDINVSPGAGTDTSTAP